MRRTATVTVLFCDLVGSTERPRRLGDDAADEFRIRFFGALSDVVRETDGELVKNTGDGLMVVFRSSAVDAVTAASRMHDQVEALDAEDPAYLRAGIAAGEAAFEDDDWFGMPVVEAARLCATAAAGQTLVSEVVRRARASDRDARRAGGLLAVLVHDRAFPREGVEARLCAGAGGGVEVGG